MERHDKPLGIVHVEVRVGERGQEIECKIAGNEGAVITAVATAIKKMAKLQDLSAHAAMYGLAGVIDLLDHTDCATIDLGAIEKARERHEE